MFDDKALRFSQSAIFSILKHFTAEVCFCCLMKRYRNSKNTYLTNLVSGLLGIYQFNLRLSWFAVGAINHSMDLDLGYHEVNITYLMIFLKQAILK